MSRYLFAFLVSLFALLLPSIAFAQTPTCTIVYGGGESDCKATASATPAITTTPSATNSGQSMTKGDQPVYPPVTTQTTPATGPEAIGLIGLIPAAALGFYLRNRTK